MNYRSVGESDLVVSEVSLGTWLSLGSHLDVEAGRACFLEALECGITSFDTADVYADGAAERELGRFLREVRRDSVVIATKCFFPCSADPDDRGLSRRHIMESAERSLRRLGTDYIDLLQCHRFDPHVPLEETVQAMDDLVRTGKVRHWGIGRFDAAQTCAVVEVALRLGAAQPVSNQYFYNLLNREIEAALVPRCRELGVSILAYSPLAQGVLTGKYGASAIPAESRAADPRLRPGMWEFRPEQLVRVERLHSIAAAAGLTPAQCSLAWCLRDPIVASVIIGATRPEQVRENAASSGRRLPPDLAAEMERL